MKPASFHPFLVCGSSVAALVTSGLAEDPRFFRIKGPVPVEITSVTADGWITWTNPTTTATFTVQTASSPSEDAHWKDWAQVPVTGTGATHRTFDPNPPEGFVWIPGGSFLMGDKVGSVTGGDGYGDELPVHSVSVSGFYMQATAVTNDQMATVLQWACDQGGRLSVTSSSVRNLEDNQELLDLDDPDCRITWNGATEKFALKEAKGSGYPCVEVTWYGSAAYCNYRSEMEGLTPAYNLSDWSCAFGTGGYRLPTEAEREKAARGGCSARRFPWGDTISHDEANYYSYWSGEAPYYPYDVNPSPGYQPDWDHGDYPYTSPVGSFPPNDYGLYDMAGNVWEWCNDWHASSYYGAPEASQPDPAGPATGSCRVRRGGSWIGYARGCRVACRGFSEPDFSPYNTGLRPVRRPPP